MIILLLLHKMPHNLTSLDFRVNILSIFYIYILFPNCRCCLLQNPALEKYYKIALSKVFKKNPKRTHCSSSGTNFETS